MAEARIDKFNLNPFLDGPTEFLTKHMALELLTVKQFKVIFGEFIDAYKRMDYPIRALPAIRIYNETWNKEADSGWILGEVLVDIIFPASIRRGQTQTLQDTVSAALCQQFRRPTFFLRLCDLVPGLNQLGKTVNVDKSLGFEWGEDIVPLTQIRLNFRLDLRVWDDYLEQQNRTKDEPFEQTLGDLETIETEIRGLRDDLTTVEATVSIDQTIEEE